MGYSVSNTGFGQEASYPRDVVIFTSLGKNLSVSLPVFGQDLDIIVSVIKWLSAAGMPAMRRGILYIPPKGVRGNLWHIPVHRPKVARQLPAVGRDLSELQSGGDHRCVLLWLCCGAQRTASFPPHFFFLSACVSCICLVFLTSGICPGKFCG